MTERSPRLQDLADQRRHSARKAWLKLSLGCFAAWLFMVGTLAGIAFLLRWSAS